MRLMTDELRRTIPPLYATEHDEDPIVRVKFFLPDAGWTWYVTEFGGEDVLFGLTVGLEVELGYFSLRELESLRGPLGLHVERDLYFELKPLSKVMMAADRTLKRRRRSR